MKCRHNDVNARQENDRNFVAIALKDAAQSDGMSMTGKLYLTQQTSAPEHTCIRNTFTLRMANEKRVCNMSGTNAILQLLKITREEQQY